MRNRKRIRTTKRELITAVPVKSGLDFVLYFVLELVRRE